MQILSDSNNYTSGIKSSIDHLITEKKAINTQDKDKSFILPNTIKLLNNSSKPMNSTIRENNILGSNFK